MKRTNGILLTAMMSTLVLSGCGGAESTTGDYDASASAEQGRADLETLKELTGVDLVEGVKLDSVPETTSDSSEVTAVGQVADGYLYGAKVCFDYNENLVCDADEPSATTASNGAYTLKGQSTGKILVEVPSTAIDADTGLEVGQNGYILSAAFENAKFISPLSTMVATHMDNGSSYEDALTQVAEDLGVAVVDKKLVVSNFIDNVSQDKATTVMSLRKSAIVAATIARERLAELKANNSIPTDAATAHALLHNVLTSVNNSAKDIKQQVSVTRPNANLKDDLRSADVYRDIKAANEFSFSSNAGDFANLKAVTAPDDKEKAKVFTSACMTSSFRSYRVLYKFAGHKITVQRKYYADSWGIIEGNPTNMELCETDNERIANSLSTTDINFQLSGLLESGLPVVARLEHQKQNDPKVSVNYAPIKMVDGNICFGGESGNYLADHAKVLYGQIAVAPTLDTDTNGVSSYAFLLGYKEAKDAVKSAQDGVYTRCLTPYSGKFLD